MKEIKTHGELENDGCCNCSSCIFIKTGRYFHIMTRRKNGPESFSSVEKMFSLYFWLAFWSGM